MPGEMIGQHEISTVGLTLSKAFTGTSVAFKLVADTDLDKLPQTFLVRCDQECYIRQGLSTVTASNAAPVSLWLKKYDVIKLTVKSAAQQYLAVIRKTTSGTIYATLNSGETPGSGSDTTM